MSFQYVKDVVDALDNMRDGALRSHLPATGEHGVVSLAEWWKFQILMRWRGIHESRRVERGEKTKEKRVGDTRLGAPRHWARDETSPSTTALKRDQTTWRLTLMFQMGVVARRIS